jgi:Lrp/AsnC family leucine-responsive transcriptional regulator
MSADLDKIDRKMLKLLQADGRLSNAELAQKVSVSPATCHRRTQRLIDEGFIKGFRALINPNAVATRSIASR